MKIGTRAWSRFTRERRAAKKVWCVLLTCAAALLLPAHAEAAVSLGASPSSVTAGAAITVSWSMGKKDPRSAKDWIGLYASGASNYDYLSRTYTGGSRSGSVMFAAPATAGTYVFRYLRNDGYTSVAQSGIVTVTASSTTDTTPPDTQITAGPAEGSSSTSTSVSFSFTGTDNVGVTAFACSFDGSAFSACSSPKSYASLATGSHTFRVRASDAAGNTDATPATRTFTVAAAVAGKCSNPQPITAWRPVGSAPLSDAEAAARITCKSTEKRPENATANAYVPSAAELESYRTGWRDKYGRTVVDYDPSNAYVTGGFTGTTDEIIQWGAQKWGIPEDWIRAQAVAESWWRQGGLGDPEHGKTPAQMSAYPAYSHIDADSVYASLGIMQIKWHPECEWNTSVACQQGGAEPLRHKSTAFNIDYLGASIRYYYDGKCYWCGTGYTAGQQWESLGAWYSPYPWKNTGMMSYIDKVKNHLAARTWESSTF